MSQILGLTGLPRCGKDTVALLLVQHFDFARYAFAGPVKDMLKAGLGLTHDEVNAPDKEVTIARIGATPRYLLQTLGTEWGREMVGPDLWIKIAEQRTHHFRKAGCPLVFTDVRFENEADHVRRLGGAIWHIKRQASTVVNLHKSNSGVALVRGVDSVITNDDGLDQLEGMVRLAMRGDLVVPKNAA